MAVAHHHRVDVLRVDAGLPHVRQQLAGGRAEDVEAAEAGVEQHQLVAGIDDDGVLLEDGVVHRQEVVPELLCHLVLGQAEEIVLRLAERQDAVGDDGALEVAELEAVTVWIQ